MTRVLFLAGLAFAHSLLSHGAAFGQSIDEARTAFAEGRFVDAAEFGEAVETSEGFALAARSLSVHGYYIAPPDEKQALFERAKALAVRAIEADATNPEAHLRSAQAMGRYAQTIGPMQAFSEGYAERVRDAIKQALALDADMASAHVSLGSWHAEVVNGAGFMADLLYGANEEDALAHYAQALELAPDAKVVLVETAIGLLILDDDEYGARARGLLERAIDLPSNDAYDKLIHRRAVDRLAALDG